MTGSCWCHSDFRERNWGVLEARTGSLAAVTCTDINGKANGGVTVIPEKGNRHVLERVRHTRFKVAGR